MSFMRKIFGRDIKSDVVAVSGTVLRVGTDTDYAEWGPALAPAASTGLTLRSTGSGEGQYGWGPALAPAASTGLTLRSTGSGEGQYGWGPALAAAWRSGLTLRSTGSGEGQYGWGPALDPAASTGLTLRSLGSGEGQYGWSVENHSLIASFNWIFTTPLVSGSGTGATGFYVTYTSASYALSASDKRSKPSYHVGAMTYTVAGLSCGANHPVGHEVFIRGLIQFGAAIEQGDSAIGDPELFLRVVDGSNVLLDEIQLVLVKKRGDVYANDLTQNSVQYYIDQPAIIDFGVDTIPSTVRIQLRVRHIMDAGGGAVATGISAIESVLLNIHYM